MACLAIESNVIYGNSSVTVCSNSPNIGYLQVADTNSLYTATKLYQQSCSATTYETTGYYRVSGDTRWRYWDESVAAFTNFGVCNCEAIEPNVYFGSSISNICNASTPLGYQQYADTNSLYTATMLYQLDCSYYNIETSGYYRVDGDTRWRYWDDNTRTFTSEGVCSTTTSTTIAGTTSTTSTTTRAPVMQPADLVFARSPVTFRYLELNPDSYYKFNLYIGLTSNPSTIYATIERIPDLDLGITIDVSNLLVNYIRNNLRYDTDNVVYFKSDLEEWDANEKIRTDTSANCVAVFGYNNVFDGVFNYTVADGTIMTTIVPNSPFGIPNTVSYSIPFKGSVSYTITYTNNSGTITTVTGTATETNEISRISCGYSDLTAISSNSNINITVGSNTYILKSDGACTGYDLYTVDFINKWGCWDKLYFSGKKDDEVNIEYELFKFNNINYANMTYDPKGGSYHKFLIQGKDKLILNSGWVDENKNEKFKEMFLSENVLISSVPYIITDKDLRYKTERGDKVMNYTVTLQKAYDSINNVK